MLAPLVSIYALIILAYGAKVLLQWELPKGEIAFLVSPFLGVGMLVWLMLEPKVLKQGGFVRFYRAAWHWVMLPAAILLGVSVIVRIREYGFTPIRLFLAMIVIWAVVQSLWFTMMPQLKRDIRIPTGVAAALLLLGAFAAEPLSASSQFNRALAAKPKLIAFSKGDALDHPEAVKVFIGAVDFLIRHKEEKYFKRLLPNQKMPENTYGAIIQNSFAILDWKHRIPVKKTSVVLLNILSHRKCRYQLKMVLSSMLRHRLLYMTKFATISPEV